MIYQDALHLFYLFLVGKQCGCSARPPLSQPLFPSHRMFLLFVFNQLDIAEEGEGVKGFMGGFLSLRFAYLKKIIMFSGFV